MLLLVVPLLLFLLITWQVLADGPLLDLDARLSDALVRPDRASELLSDLGNVEVAVPVLALALAVTAWRLRARGVDRWWLPPAAGAAAMLLVPVLVAPLKAWTDRPGTPAVPPATGYFPSGHTATAVVAYGAATLLLLRLPGSPAVRRGLVALCALLILGASYGLVRRGYHWPLDVAASWCLGAVLLAGVVLVSRSSRRTSAGTPSRRSGPS
ncbi:phosphatase PAP2 family protein [Streptomyces albogriseolus]|uniref:Membrane-associated phospholipid phosphatase n=1 Tax=Streptomyces albogriseolus TaxID=1887 RepID=A0ACC6UTA2_STRAO|nr:phosphatase PAP2 family protein [Streptomyces viridodiastaticus]MCX4622684.1 phosphatase PAP2 family protein [Streptomyces viridodiastaticus]GHG39823.1 membrane protein [Streptomyces viridodiastaticus]